MIREFQGPYRFLSNFWLVPVAYEGEVYPSVEHAYQAAKTDDPHWRLRIKHCDTPGQAKRLGKQAPLRRGWEGRKLEVMRELVWRKFCTNDLLKRLIATHPQELIEGNTWGDTYWGVCRGVGQNHLGKLLMETRTQLIASGMASDE